MSDQQNVFFFVINPESGYKCMFRTREEAWNAVQSIVDQFRWEEIPAPHPPTQKDCDEFASAFEIYKIVLGEEFY
jgi:hypothetical protein